MGITANPVYDANGVAIPNTSGTIEVKNPSWATDIEKGDKFFAVYDSIACKYFPLVGGAGKTTFYNTGVCYISSAQGCQAPEDRGCWLSDTIILGSGLQATQVPINPNDGCGTLPSGTGTFLSLRVPVYDVADTGSAGSTSMSAIKKLGNECVSDWGTLVFGSGMSVYTGGRGDQTGPNVDCDFVYIESSGAACSNKAVNINCATAKAGWCGPDVAGLTLGLSNFGSACKGLIAGPGLFMYDVTGAKTIGSTNVSGYQYLETALAVGLGCGEIVPGQGRKGNRHHPTNGYVKGLETINLGCGLSGTGITTCSADGTYVCDTTIHINPACYHGITNVQTVADICCSGGSGLIVAYKQLSFTDCGLFTGVVPWKDCDGNWMTMGGEPH